MAWRVKVLYSDQHELLEVLRSPPCTGPVLVYALDTYGRNLVISYPSEEIKAFLKLKFDLIDD